MMDQAWTTDPSAFFRHNGFVPIPKLIDLDLVSFLDRSAILQMRSGLFEEDLSQVVGSKVSYGNPTFETVLEDQIPALSEVLGIRLLPTYSFVRHYVAAMVLAPHTDRAACEISVTVHLGSDLGSPWPICIGSRSGENVAIVLQPGDAVAYEGCDVSHWRNPCPNGSYRQLFLHYVGADGRHADRVFDERTALGHPAPERRKAAPSPEHVDPTQRRSGVAPPQWPN